jgi:hypothetical protein
MNSFYREIDAEYDRLGYNNGWSFLATPERTLRDAAVAFVGLNPGGGGPQDDYEYGRLWDFPGNAYFDEKWGPGGTETAIQGQIRAWHELLGLKPDESLCAHFIPFRSPTWESLDHKPDALAFAEKLWQWVFDISPATLFVTMGKKPASHLAALLEGTHVAQLPTGWGKQMIDVWDTPSGRRIVGMPHPSRYRLLNRGDGLSDVAVASFLAATGPGRQR